jgi:hypothetical protein
MSDFYQGGPAEGGGRGGRRGGHRGGGYYGGRGGGGGRYGKKDFSSQDSAQHDYHPEDPLYPEQHDNPQQKPISSKKPYGKGKSSYSDRQSDQSKVANDQDSSIVAPPAMFSDNSAPPSSKPETKKKETAQPSTKQDKEKEKEPPAPQKKTQKLIIRKLPASKNYTLPEFEKHFSKALSKLSLPENHFRIDHFTSGKLRYTVLCLFKFNCFS